MTVRAGALVAGRYRVEEPLGSGGTDVVWRARDERYGRTVVLRRTHEGSDKQSLRRIQRWGLTGLTTHPRIAAVYGVVVDEDIYWLVSEYVGGRDLARILNEDGVLSAAEAARIGRQLAEALEAIHEAGFVHGDVSPANVLITANGEAKLTGLDTARSIWSETTVTDDDIVPGAPPYLAPEVARGEEKVPASDVFSLGATLYTAVEGVSPLGETGNPLAYAWRAGSGMISTPSVRGPLKPVLSAMLAADPADRPDAVEARQLLAEAAAEARANGAVARLNSLIGRLARSVQERKPLLHVTVSPWWARVLIAAGARRAAAGSTDSMAVAFPAEPRVHHEAVRPAPALRRRNLAFGLAAAIAVILAVVTVGIYRPLRINECATGVARVDVRQGGKIQSECIGVTDAYPFQPRYRALFSALRKENRSAVSAGPGTYMTIAYLGDLTRPDPQMLYRLEGAVTAQHEANIQRSSSDRPRIRLAIANVGSDGSPWSQVTDTLIKMTRSDDHLVAVAGVGLGQRRTYEVAARLATAHLPVVGDTSVPVPSTTSSDMAQVAPRSQDEVAALSSYLGKTARAHTALLVGDDREDAYSRSLTQSFRNQFGHLLTEENNGSLPFGADPRNDPRNDFAAISHILCNSPRLKTVLFSGRPSDLPQFISFLADRPCHTGRISVAVDSEAVSAALLDPEHLIALQSHKDISLVYTQISDPGTLLDPRINPEANVYASFQRTFTAMGFNHRDLTTGAAILSHDAVLAEVTAAQRTSPTSGNLSPASAVRNQLRLMGTQETEVPGASGPIRFDTETGERVGVALPILRLNPGQRPPTRLGVYHSR